MQEILLHTQEGVLTLTLNRVDKKNAITAAMYAEMARALKQATQDPAVRVVLIQGHETVFSAGNDLADFMNQPPQGADSSVFHFLQAVSTFPKPLVAAVSGPAVGIGATMTLPMDFRLASEAAKIGFVFTRRGIVPEACSSWFLPRLVGIAQAQEWVMTGRVFPAQEALAGGLVRSVHPAGQLLDAARTLAKEIIDNTAPVSVALARQMMWRMLGASHPMEAHRVDSRGIQIRGRSNDVKEGVMSFLEKRPAQFVDRVSSDVPDIFPGWSEPEFF